MRTSGKKLKKRKYNQEYSEECTLGTGPSSTDGSSISNDETHDDTLGAATQKTVKKGA